MSQKQKWSATVALVLALMLLVSCQPPTPTTSETTTPSSPILQSADVPTISLPQPTPIPVHPTRPPEDAQFWGYRPLGPYDNEPDESFDPTFYEEILSNQDYVAEAVTDFYQICYDVPPALASTVSAFPSITQSCGIRTSDPYEINRLMYESKNGGEIQTKLLEAFEELLKSGGTDLEIVHVSGEVRFTQAYLDEVPVYEGFDTLTLFWSEPVQLRDATLLKITRNFADSTKEVGYFDLNSYFCRCLSNEDFPY